MTKRIPLVAIVGRTNVGKSTLFNTLAGRKFSIVEDQPGVTRDRNYLLINRHGFPFTLIDTGGIAREDEHELASAVREQTELAISECDLVVAVFDGMAGVHPMDEEVVDLLRKAQKPVIWLVNKCESPKIADSSGEFYALGIKDLLCISAAHQIGIGELIKEIRARLGDLATDGLSEQKEGVIGVAILGRPNVGKSSLVNKILGEQRLVASDIPGTTRDAIDIELLRDGKHFTIVDTAGLRKKARVDDATVERYSNLRSMKALARCDVAVLVIDATAGMPTEQDTKIAGLIHERGRGLVIVVNKWDLIEKDHTTSKGFRDAVKEAFKFAPYAPTLFVSAVTGQRCPQILRKVAEVYENMNVRIPTSAVNKLLNTIFYSRPPPVYRGQPIKLFFATQVDVAPPTFVLFVSHPKKLGFSYQRYVRNSIRKEFPFEGCDIKLEFRKKGEEDENETERRRA